MPNTGRWFLPLLPVFFLLAIFLAGSSPVAAQEKKLLFLGNRNIEPIVYLEGDEPAGVAVDIVRALSPHLPQPVEIRAMDWKEAQALVAQGEADALIQINATEERKRIYDFSGSLLESQFSIFTAANRVGISGVSSLAGHKVGVEAGGLPHLILEKDPRVALTIIPNFIDGFRQVESGVLDAVVVDYRVGSYVLAENKIRDIKATGEPIAVSSSAFAVRKGNAELLAAINKALQTIRADGTYQEILDKWRPAEGVFQTQRQISQRMYVTVLVFFAILLLVAVLWAVTLKRELAAKKKARLSLQEQCATLRAIIDNTSASIFSLDSRCRYTSFNREHAALMKTMCGAEIALGESVLDQIPRPAERETARCNLGRALAGEQFTAEVSGGEGQQDRRYFQISHNPIRLEAGAVIGVAVVAQDISERKREEQAVSASEARFRSLFEDSPVSLWEEDFSQVKHQLDALRASGVTDFRAHFDLHPEDVVRMAGAVRVITINQATLKLCKAADREHLLAGLCNIFTEESFAVFKEELITLASGGTRFQSEAVHKTLTGETVDTEIRLSVAPGYEESWQKVLVSVIDLTEWKRTEAARLANIRFLENLDRVNRAIQGADDLQRMMSDVLEEILTVFGCDRAFLLYPCNPEAETWRVPMERTRPEYPGVLVLGSEMPMDADLARTLHVLLKEEGPVQFGSGTAHELPLEVSEQFGFKSFMSMAIYPKVGEPWQFGVHQCAHSRVWTREEERLFQEIGRRIADALSLLLVYCKLQESESRFRRIIDTALEGILVLGPETQVTFANARMAEMLGHQVEELLGKPMSAFLIEEELPAHHTRMENRRQGKTERYECRFRHRDGNTVWALAAAVPLFDEARVFQGSFGMFTDITDRKESEEAIRRLNEELEQGVTARTDELQNKTQQLLGSRQALMNLVEDLNQKTVEFEEARIKAEAANRAKSIFLANMSHELRTPLNAIMGFTQILMRSGQLQQEQREGLAIITRSGEHLLALINDVLEIAKIEAGSTHLSNAPFDLHRLIRDISGMFRARAESGRLSFLMDISQELPRVVDGDAGKIRQVLINLLGNAVKYTNTGGIRLSATSEGPAAGEPDRFILRCEVKDSGIGIPEDKLGIIFDPFVQVPRSGKQETGTGLGLSISRHFIELMGGRIGVSSKLDAGSTFFFDIPLALSTAEIKEEVRPARRAKAVAAGQPPPRILIVEDREENRLLLRRLLEGVGLVVLEAVNGAEAVERVQTKAPDFVWMDIRMPVMDGYEATRRIKATEAGARTPVVALTASAFEEQRGKIMAAGCDGFVRKPFKEEEIWSTLEKHLGIRFVYEDEPEPSPAPPPVALAAETLARLDRQLLLELAKAALACKRDTCLEIIDRLSKMEGDGVAQGLKTLVMKHQFDNLHRILEDHLEGSSN